MRQIKQILIGVCERYCDHYKPGSKEESACRGIIALSALHESGHWTLDKYPDRKDDIPPEIDAIIARNVCSKCDWRESDCDYRDPETKRKANPCGGVVLLALLLASGEITENDF